MIRRLCLHLAAAVTLVVTVTGQTSGRTATLIGRVVDAVSNAPLAGAIVALSGGGTTPRRVLVDDQGRFLFVGLPSGSYSLSATRARYLDGSFGRTRPDGEGRTIDLRDGDHVLDAVVKMWRPAIISGTVTDDAGDPVSGARVLIFKRTVVAGRWRFVPVGRGAATDDRGVYRSAPLMPGEYTAATTASVISAPVAVAAEVDAIRRAGGTAADDFVRKVIANGAGSPLHDLYQGFQMTRMGDMFVTVSGPTMPTAGVGAMNLYATAWSPSATSPAQATVTALGPGDERSGIDVHLVLSPTFRVSGTVAGSDGPVASLGLRLQPAGFDDVADETSFFSAVTATAADGTFTFVGVHPGQYVVRGGTFAGRVENPLGGTMLSRDPTIWVATPVSVGESNVAGVAVAAHAGVRVTGRIAFDGTSPRPSPKDLLALPVKVEPIDGRTVSFFTAIAAQVDAEGAFYTSGLPGGRYFIRASGSVGPWTLKSAIVNGRDVADMPLVVESTDIDGLVLTLTDHPSALRGQVRSAQGASDADATVIVFPADTTAWRDVGASPRRLRSVRVSRSGSYAVAGLPAGEYDVIAVGDAAAANWLDPMRLAELARAAARVIVVDGQQASVDLTTVIR